MAETLGIGLFKEDTSHQRIFIDFLLSGIINKIVSLPSGSLSCLGGLEHLKGKSNAASLVCVCVLHSEGRLPEGKERPI